MPSSQEETQGKHNAMNWQALWLDVQRHWLLYVSIPFVSGIIGYVTKVVAIRMMFQPLEFFGILKPYLGWQGIIPRKADKMASIAVDTITTKLISVREVFDKIEPVRVAQEIQTPLLEAVELISREVLSQQHPTLWEGMPAFVRNRVIDRIKREAPATIAEVMADIRTNIENYFDLKHMVVTCLVRDKALLNRIFAEVGREEFKFFTVAGFYFGFTIGIVQMVAWVLTKSHWILPAFGLFVGFFSDWLALQMLFEPKRPVKVLGYTFQGLFLKRQQTVAREYAELITKELITPRNMLEELFRGTFSDRLVALVQRHVQRMVDEQAGLARPFVALAVGSRGYQDLKRIVAERVLEQLPATMVHMEGYAADAMGVQALLVRKMQALTPEEFEGLLRPAFKEDEWMLIAVGAALGFIVGEMQVLVMTSRWISGG